jgi:hypothetical protein
MEVRPEIHYFQRRSVRMLRSLHAVRDVGVARVSVSQWRSISVTPPGSSSEPLEQLGIVEPAPAKLRQGASTSAQTRRCLARH